jgi:proteasome activator subunit 4
VLGLKAFVLACPYDVPPWLPEVLLALVRASAQPPPIKTSVRCGRRTQGT